MNALVLIAAALLTAAPCWGPALAAGPAAQKSALLVFEIDPPDGEVWLGKSKYPGRQVRTPPLGAGRYSYEATIRWLRDGKVIEKKIDTPAFSPGDVVRVPVCLVDHAGDVDGESGPMEGATIGQAGEINFGLDLKQLGQPARKTTINGQEVSRDKAFEALVGGKLPDDKGLLRLTAIGPKEFTGKVLEDLARQPDLKGKLLVQTYTPDAWQVKDAGFKVSAPQVYLTQPNGLVEYRDENYTAGPEGLFAAIRKANPNYRPENDPGPGGQLNELVLAAILAGLGLLMSRA